MNYLMPNIAIALIIAAICLIFVIFVACKWFNELAHNHNFLFLYEACNTKGKQSIG